MPVDPHVLYTRENAFIVNVYCSTSTTCTLPGTIYALLKQHMTTDAMIISYIIDICRVHHN